MFHLTVPNARGSSTHLAERFLVKYELWISEVQLGAPRGDSIPVLRYPPESVRHFELLQQAA